jgi:hypothetical protein
MLPVNLAVGHLHTHKIPPQVGLGDRCRDFLSIGPRPLLAYWSTDGEAGRNSGAIMETMRIRLAAVGVVLLVIGAGGIATAAQPQASPIKVHLALPKGHIEAGQPIKATVLLTNTTSRTITVNACADNGWLQVGLKGHGYTFKASDLLLICPPSVHLTPGINRFSVKILTTYEGCDSPGGGTATSPIPFRVSNRVPHLPAGKYSTRVSIMGLEHLTSTPDPLVVALPG